MDDATASIALEDPRVEPERADQEALHGRDVLIDQQRDDVLRVHHCQEPPGQPSTGVLNADGDAKTVAPTGFEPVMFALRGRCPRPLDEGAAEDLHYMASDLLDLRLRSDHHRAWHRGAIEIPGRRRGRALG